jgi:hypothetical protein
VSSLGHECLLGDVDDELSDDGHAAGTAEAVADGAEPGPGLTAAIAVAPLRALRSTLPADDVLICTYTANLGFFSKAAAERSRARGARVSVISDPAQTAFDPELVRGAGSEWLDGRAWCRGAFHPKLIVAASDTHATVLVGSGNATPAGWVGNAELWVRFDADNTTAPPAVAAGGAWLSGLVEAAESGAVSLGPGVVDAMTAAAKRLAAYAPGPGGPALSGDACADGATLVSNLTAPIFYALPDGAVDELVVCSPFLDSSSLALAAVCERLQPTSLTVMVADDFSLDGLSLNEVVARWGGQLVRIASDRPHHGKLLEWSVDGRRQALIGSANVTRAGLMRTLGDPDTNCELGIICDVPTTLAPGAGDAVTAAEVAGRVTIKPSTSAAPMLVGAIIGPEGTTLALTRAHPVPLIVEVFDAARGLWVAAAIIPAATADGGTVADGFAIVIPAGMVTWTAAGWWPKAGRPLRVRAATGPASVPYPVTDLSRLTPRRPAKRQLPGQADEFADDPEFLAQLGEALARIAANWKARHNAKPGGPGGPTPGGQAGAGTEPDDAPDVEQVPPSWQAQPYLASEVGDAFSDFVLPRLGTDSVWIPRDPGGDPGPGGTEEDPAGDDGRAARRRLKRKRDLRRWVLDTLDPARQSGALAEARRASQGTSTLADVCIAAVALSAWALDVFSEAELVTVLERALERLAGIPETPDIVSPAASLAAVGLWVLDGLAGGRSALDEGIVVGPRFARLGAMLSGLLAQIDDPALEARCSVLVTSERDWVGPNPSEVAMVALRAASPDAVGDVAAALEAETNTVAEVSGRVITLAGTLGDDGEVAVLRAWDALSHAAPIAITATAAKAGRVLFCWDGRSLVEGRQLPRRRVRRFELASLSVVAAAENRRPPGSFERTSVFLDGPDAKPVPEVVVAVLDACGADLGWLSP